MGGASGLYALAGTPARLPPRADCFPAQMLEYFAALRDQLRRASRSGTRLIMQQVYSGKLTWQQTANPKTLTACGKQYRTDHWCCIFPVALIYRASSPRREGYRGYGATLSCTMRSSARLSTNRAQFPDPRQHRM